MSSIIWLASYPKSGNTWVRAFLQNYLDASDGPANINELERYFADESKPNWYLPFVDKPLTDLDMAEICALRGNVHKAIAASRPGSILVKTHNFLGEYNGLPLHEMSVTAGGVYIVRNPLDVLLSLADHFGLSIDEAIEFMNSETTGSPTDEANVASVLSSWSVHVKSWADGGGDATCVLRYEDLLAKPAKAFKSLVSFLGLKSNPKLLRQAIRFSSFSELRKQEKQKGFVEKSPNSSRFFRAGKKDQWRSRLTREQAGKIVDGHREVMQRFRYVPSGY
jgi:hypothetical protein